MSSFDYELKDQLRRAGAPVLSDYERRYRAFEGAVYNTPPDVSFDVDAEIEALGERVRKRDNRLVWWGIGYGLSLGILATLAVQHIFGAA